MLALHALAVVAVIAALLLGLWQYGVWQDARENRTASRVHEAPRPLGTVLSADEAFPAADVGRPVAFTGRWLPGSTVYVANRPLHGRHGVWAVTPVAVCGDAASCRSAPAVLVVRGWAADRSHAPAPPHGTVRISGWLQPGEGSDDPDPNPDDDVIPQLRVADVLQRVDRDLYGGYVIRRISATAGTTTGRPGLAAVTPANLPRPAASTSLRNLLYALEWWAFGAFAVYAWWRWCRDEVTRVTGVASSA
jgi:surfeit locus 1 family protein